MLFGQCPNRGDANIVGASLTHLWVFAGSRQGEKATDSATAPGADWSENSHLPQVPNCFLVLVTGTFVLQKIVDFFPGQSIKLRNCVNSWVGKVMLLELSMATGVRHRGNRCQLSMQYIEVKGRGPSFRGLKRISHCETTTKHIIK